MNRRIRSVIIVSAALAFGGETAVLAADKPTWTAAQLKTLNFRCTVADGPKLTACKPQRAARINPLTVEYSRTAVESLASCVLGHLKPGTEVTYPFPYSDDPAYLENPIQPHVVKSVDYAEPPPLTEIARLYPEEARRARVPGRVVLKCIVGLDGKATNCAVLEESPSGYGFAKASLTALEAFRFTPKTYDCIPTDTGMVVVPINFVPPR
jgi:TonB family protein